MKSKIFKLILATCAFAFVGSACQGNSSSSQDKSSEDISNSGSESSITPSTESNSLSVDPSTSVSSINPDSSSSSTTSSPSSSTTSVNPLDVERGISFTTDGHATYELSKDKAKRGETITVTVIPDYCFKVYSILSDQVGFKALGNNQFSFVMPMSNVKGKIRTEYDKIVDGSVGGSLIEINTGTPLALGDVYHCSFSLSTWTDKRVKFKVQDDDILELKQDTIGSGSFTITPKKAGETVVKAYSLQDEVLVYRDLIKVVDKISENKIADYMFGNTDYWVSTGIYGDYRMSFVNDDPLSFTLNGKDSMENTYLQADLQYIGLQQPPVGTDFTYYMFDINLDLDKSSTERKYSYLYISTTGDSILIYYYEGEDEGLFEMFMQE